MRETVTVGIVSAAAVIVCILGILIWVGQDAVKYSIRFGLVFSRHVILLVGYKLFDMICFDWILLTKPRIFQARFPETIDRKGYETFGFNFKSQVVKIVAFLLPSPFPAALVVRL